MTRRSFESPSQSLDAEAIYLAPQFTRPWPHGIVVNGVCPPLSLALCRRLSASSTHCATRFSNDSAKSEV